MFTLSPEDVQQSLPFLHALLRKKRTAQKNAFEKGSLHDLTVLFRMLILVLLGEREGLNEDDRARLYHKRKTLLKAGRSETSVKDTLKNRDKLRVCMKPLLGIIPSVVRLFVKDNE